MTARTSFTPAVTADNSTKRRPVARETTWARVVLPVPGGPHRITEAGPARPDSPGVVSASRRRGEPGSSR